MKLTGHARERIYGRSKLHPDDVLTILASNAAVFLGSSDEFDYFLFYSKPDRDTKVAVVAESRTVLVSVWEKHYTLPPGVRPVTWRNENKAWKAFRNFFIERIKASLIQTQSKILEVRISVNEKSESVFLHYCGTLTEKEVGEPKSLVLRFKNELAPIFEVIEENNRAVNGHVSYSFLLFEQGTEKVLRSIKFTHKLLTKVLKTA